MVTDGKTSRLDDGTLAGALDTIDQCVRNVVAWTDIAPAVAIGMASTVPAQLLGLSNTGRIAEGLDADLVLMDDGLNVQATFVQGRQAFMAPTYAPVR